MQKSDPRARQRAAARRVTNKSRQQALRQLSAIARTA